MKGMQKIRRGTGFRGLLLYAHGDGEGRLIGGNVAGNGPVEMARRFRSVAAFRPEIEKPVWHNSLRMPKGEDIDDDRWNRIATSYLKRMGFDLEKTQYAIFKHDDEHVHLIVNRVQFDGGLYLGQNENLKSTRVIQRLERAYKLTITPGPERDQDGKIVMPELSKPTKNEIDKAVRLLVSPARLILQEAVSKAAAGQPPIANFIKRLEDAGIVVIPNVASTGRMNGFSFAIADGDGITFSGSKLGAKFKWAALQKELIYDEVRDAKDLADTKTKAGSWTASREAASGNLGETSEFDRNNVDLDASERAADSSDGRDPADHGRTGGDDQIIGEGAGRAPERDDERAIVAAGSNEAGRTDRENFTAEPNRKPDDIGVIHAVGIAARGPSREGATEENAREVGRQLEPADLIAKRAAWDAQHAALGAPAYRLTLIDRRTTGDDARSWNPGKRKDKDGAALPEKFWTADEVADRLPRLRQRNARGFDIYLTPMDPDHHHLVIDDLTPSTLDQLRAAGHTPALVQQSSAGNLQAILIVPKIARADEQRLANAVVVDLNRRYGDPKFSGVIHPFRMAGFSNKKPGRGNAFTVIVQAVRQICAKAAQRMASLRAEADDWAIQLAQQRAVLAAERAARGREAAHQVRAIERQGAAADFASHAARVGGDDASRRDFGAAAGMLRQGYSADEVVQALRDHSPDLHERHSDAERYAVATVTAAQARIDAQTSTPSARHRP